VKLVTWNVNSLNVRLPRLVGWLAANAPDVVGLQETKTEDAKFPHDELRNAGYVAHAFGQRTYNGVALLVREGLAATDVVAGLPGFADEQKRVIAATVAGVRVVNAYVPNGQAVGSDKYAYKLAWLEQLATYTQAQLAIHPKLLLLGDFNTYPREVLPGWPELNIPLDAGFRTTQDTVQCTVPTSNQNCPDWIFTSPDLPAAAVTVVIDRPDHRPIAATVYIPG